MPHTEFRSRRQRRGSAMIETVLALPFLLVIFALVLFFGQNFIRAQKTSSYDRYESWRAQAYAPGPEAEAVGSDQDLTDGVQDQWDTTQLSAAFFGGDPTSRVSAQVSSAFPDDASYAFSQLVPDTGGAGDLSARALAERMWVDEVGGLPRGRQVRLSTTHAARSRFESSLLGPLTHRFTRPDGDWRYVNDVLDPAEDEWYDRGSDQWRNLYTDRRPDRVVSPSPYLRELYFQDLDAAVSGISGVNALAWTVQNFYLRIPAYHGPKLPTSWDRDGGYSY